MNPVPTKTLTVAQLSHAMGLRAGVPDFLCCFRGKMFGIEMKAKAGSLSPAQKEMHKTLGEDGVNVYTVRSLEELIGVFVKEGCHVE